MFSNTIRVSNGLDPDEDGLVGPDLGTNCLKRYQQTTKKKHEKFPSRQRVKSYSHVFGQLRHVWNGSVLLYK